MTEQDWLDPDQDRRQAGSLVEALQARARSGQPMHGFRLKYADLAGIDLVNHGQRQGWELQGADLYRADLQNAHLFALNLRGASLMKADLRGANLRCADLSSANMRGADLRGANLRGADISRLKARHFNLTREDQP